MTNSKNSSGPVRGSAGSADGDIAPPSVQGAAMMIEDDTTSHWDDLGPDEDEMPPLKYSRLFGSLPRRMQPQLPPQSQHGESASNSIETRTTTETASMQMQQGLVANAADTSATNGIDRNFYSSSQPLRVECTCSVMGRVKLSSTTIGETLQLGGGSTGSTDNPNHQYLKDASIDLLSQQLHYVLAMGYKDGNVSLLDAKTGLSVMNGGQQFLSVRDRDSSSRATDSQAQKVPITDVSMDASGTFLAAMDEKRMCAIFEFKYEPGIQQLPTSQSQFQFDGVGTRGFNNSDDHHQQQPQPSPPPQQTTVDEPPAAADNIFSNFMSALTGGTAPAQQSHAPPPPPPAAIEGIAASTATANSAVSAKPSSSAVQSIHNNTVCLLATTTQVSRVGYPESFGIPTCISLDPSYKRRREKVILVGFADGRLVLTKRGFLQRRTDNIIYQGAASGSVKKNYNGIEAIEWRGPLVAWADASGIRLFDIDTLTRIAHIDRPAGARPTLYPTLSSLRPTLRFETSNRMIVAWGDCLMGLYIRDSPSSLGMPAQQRRESSASSTSTGGPDSGSQQQAPPPPQQTIVLRRTVECTMAWELDCVACGVVPLDATHVLVLGLVPPYDDDERNRNNNTATTNGNIPDLIHEQYNELEIQIVSRVDGTVLHSDVLPLLDSASVLQRNGDGDFIPESASAYTLLSSFAVARMEDAVEEEEDGIIVADDNANVSLFGGPRKVFRDSHLQWQMQTITFDDTDEFDFHQGADEHERLLKIKSDEDGQDDSSVRSVDSDDYEFIFRPLSTATGANVDGTSENKKDLVDKSPLPSHTVPPVMMVVSSSDAVQGLVRGIDDSITHALSMKKTCLALKRALTYKRMLRRYKISDVVNEYLCALLRIQQRHTLSPNSNIRSGTPPVSTLFDTNQQQRVPKPLSIRRLNLAAKALPILIGGDVDLWEYWICEFEKIPGAVFVIRDQLPVRDPKLPPELYSKVLKKMLVEVEQLTISSEKTDTFSLQAGDHFLSTLVAWGPLSVLREHVKFYGYSGDGNNYESGVGKMHHVVTETSRALALKEAEAALHRRLTQSAAGYLRFSTSNDQDAAASANHTSGGGYSMLTENALFDLQEMMQVMAIRNPIISGDSGIGDITLSDRINSKVSLDAMAKLNVMCGKYEITLKCFMVIGALYSPRSLADVEARAISVVTAKKNSWQLRSQLDGSGAYDYVLALIDNHHLHQYLLDDTFISPGSKKFRPLFCLMQLVGLDKIGKFLIQHCVAAQNTAVFDPSSPGSVASASASGTENGRPQPGPPSTPSNAASSSSVPSSGGERRGTLPLDLVADQLRESPEILLWYLHLVLRSKPELYVLFPNTAYPPKAVTDLHRVHFKLYVQNAGSERNSVLALSGTELYKMDTVTTPLLTFLKAALPLGGVRPDDVRKQLEIQREKVLQSDEESVRYSPIFALELAYVIEQYGNNTEEEALYIIDLYSRGAKSLTLAVFYAQRAQPYTTMLWDILIDYCLHTGPAPPSQSPPHSLAKASESIEDTHVVDVEELLATEEDQKEVDGSLFGALLEAAALSGADLANLVTKIPPGMSIEGLRPRLVAAVADYRLKLKTHEAAIDIGVSEKLGLLGEVSHRSRRGTMFRYDAEEVMRSREMQQLLLKRGAKIVTGKIAGDAACAIARSRSDGAPTTSSNDGDVKILPKTLRPVPRHDRKPLSISLPIR